MARGYDRMSYFDDPRLKPILEKVEAGERLSFEDGVTLYHTSDIWLSAIMANLVRERLHGDLPTSM